MHRLILAGPLCALGSNSASAQNGSHHLRRALRQEPSFLRLKFVVVDEASPQTDECDGALGECVLAV